MRQHGWEPAVCATACPRWQAECLRLIPCCDIAAWMTGPAGRVWMACIDTGQFGGSAVGMWKLRYWLDRLYRNYKHKDGAISVTVA